MATWSIKYPLNISPLGTNRQDGFEKHVLEFTEVYNYLNLVRKAQAGTIAPTAPETNDLWLDTSGTTPILKCWSGSIWVTISSPSITNRNTVLQGHVDEFGNNKLFEAGTGLAVKLNATSREAIFTFMNGNSASQGAVDLIASVSADSASFWSSLPTNSTVYLYVDYNSGTPSGGFTTIAPVYQNYAPSHASGKHWFDFNTGKVWSSDGSAWTQRNRIVVGTATTDGAGVTAVNVYLYNQVQIERIVTDDIVAKGPLVDVRAFGAVGDGVANDYTAFAAMLTAIGSSQATVVIAKPYKTASAITFPANVYLRFDNGGKIIGSAGTEVITIVGPAYAPDKQIFQNCVVQWGYYQYVKPEWWGAVANGTTDDRAAINAAYTSLVNGGEVIFAGKTYGISGSIGFAGTVSNYTRKITTRGAGMGKTIIQVNASTGDGLFVQGYDITHRAPYPEVYDLTITRGASYFPGTSGVGFSLRYTSMAKVRNVQVFEFPIGVDQRWSPNTIMDNVQVNMSQGSAQFVGFNLYCNDTVANVSSVYTNCWAAAVGTTGASNIGFKVYGDTPMDLTFISPSTAGGLAYGFYWDGSATSVTGYNSDNHIINPIIDAFSLYGIDIESNLNCGAITIMGGWINAGAAGAQCIRTMNSRNVKVIGTQIKNIAHYNNVQAWHAENCQNLGSQVSIVDCHYGLYWSSCANSNYNGTSVFSLNTLPFYNAISFLSCINCMGTGVVVDGWGTTGIYFDSGCRYCGLGFSAVSGANITNKIVNSGSNTQLGYYSTT